MKRKDKQLFMAYVLLALFGLATALVSAQAPIQTFNYCSPDNSTLIHVRQVRIEVAEPNLTRTFNVTENEHCYFDCDPETRSCKFPQWIYLIVIMIVLVVAYLIFKFVIYPMVSK